MTVQARPLNSRHVPLISLAEAGAINRRQRLGAPLELASEVPAAAAPVAQPVPAVVFGPALRIPTVFGNPTLMAEVDALRAASAEVASGR